MSVKNNRYGIFIVPYRLFFEMFQDTGKKYDIIIKKYKLLLTVRAGQDKRRNRMSGIVKKIGLGLATLVVIGVAFFFLYVVKTPHYSLYQIHKAVQSHDTVLFEQHVDLDTVYSKGIDDLVVSAVQGQKSIGLDIFTAGILKLVKPTVVHTLRDATLESVRKVPARETAQPGQSENGQATQKETGKTSQKKNKMENSIPLLKKMKERVDVSNLKIKDATVTQNDNNTTDVAVVLHNIKLNRDFNVNMRMAKLYNGEWQIKEITNFAEFLTAVEEATKQAAKEAARETVQEKKKQ